MTVAKRFILIAPLYLIIGILIGGYMGASQDHTLAPAHAHINLLGFTLMSIFGLIYALFPRAADSRLAQLHFWLHQVGSLVLLVMLMLLFTDQIGEDQMFPIAPIAEALILLGILCFTLNIYRNLD